MGRGVAWTVCRSMGELGKKEEGGVFEGMGLIPQCTLCNRCFTSNMVSFPLDQKCYEGSFDLR